MHRTCPALVFMSEWVCMLRLPIIPRLYIITQACFHTKAKETRSLSLCIHSCACKHPVPYTDAPANASWHSAADELQLFSTGGVRDRCTESLWNTWVEETCWKEFVEKEGSRPSMAFHLTSTHCLQSRPVLMLRSVCVCVSLFVQERDRMRRPAVRWSDGLCLTAEGGGEMERKTHMEGGAVKTLPCFLLVSVTRLHLLIHYTLKAINTLRASFFFLFFLIDMLKGLSGVFGALCPGHEPDWERAWRWLCEREKHVPVIEINESLGTAMILWTFTLLQALSSGVVCVSWTDLYWYLFVCVLTEEKTCAVRGKMVVLCCFPVQICVVCMCEPKGQAGLDSRIKCSFLCLAKRRPFCTVSRREEGP